MRESAHKAGARERTPCQIVRNYLISSLYPQTYLRDSMAPTYKVYALILLPIVIHDNLETLLVQLTT